MHKCLARVTIWHACVGGSRRARTAVAAIVFRAQMRCFWRSCRRAGDRATIIFRDKGSGNDLAALSVLWAVRNRLMSGVVFETSDGGTFVAPDVMVTVTPRLGAEAPTRLRKPNLAGWGEKVSKINGHPPDFSTTRAAEQRAPASGAGW